MRKAFIIVISVLAVLFTLWYMHFGSLTENSGALSVTGLSHPVYFTIWGILTFCGIFSNLLLAYKKFLPKQNFQYIFFVLSAVGMILTLAFDFDFLFQLQVVFSCCFFLISVKAKCLKYLLLLLGLSWLLIWACFWFLRKLLL